MSVAGESKRRYASLIENVLPYRGLLLLAMLFMLGGSALALLNPWLAGQFTASLLDSELAGRFSYQQILLIWLMVLGMQGLIGFGNRYLMGATGEKILAGLRIRLYDHLQALPLNYFHERKRGKILALITNDADILSYFATSILSALLPQLVTLLGALFFIFLIDPFLAMLIAIFVPFLFLMIKILGRQIRPVSRAMMDEYAETFAIVEENLQLLPIIKSFTREAIESQRFQQGNQRLLDLTTRYQRIQAMLSPVFQFITAAAVLVLLWITADQLKSGQLTSAQLVSLLLYGMLLTRPVSSFADLYGQVQRVRGAAERLAEVFAVEPEPSNQGGVILHQVRGEIEFKDIHFTYPGRDKTLSGVNLKIEAGETVAINGRNGSGKSTLVHLLQRFADPSQGQILIDGIDISTVDLTSLRVQIGVVPQEVLLLNASVNENIAFGRSMATEQEVEAAAQAAHALEFVRRLPEGFATLIGDQGVKLSGGQKQRIALARALLKDPAILVLDEATAMFDIEGERGFIAECRDLLHQKTVILITHRKASLALADRIVELDTRGAIGVMG